MAMAIVDKPPSPSQSPAISCGIRRSADPGMKMGFVKLAAPPRNARLSWGNTTGLGLSQLPTEESTMTVTNENVTAVLGEKLKLQKERAGGGKSTNVVWHKSSICKLDRQQLLQQRGCVIWITGLSGSGKSTIACALSQALFRRGKLTYILDGDNVRHGLCQDLTFNAMDRAENIRRIGEVAKLFADAGIICIASVISPYRNDRDACRSLLPQGDFIEVFMDVPLDICEHRDPKGLYKLARAGKITGFTGVDDPYEPPLNCEITLRFNRKNCCSPVDMAETVISYLEEKSYLEVQG